MPDLPLTNQSLASLIVAGLGDVGCCQVVLSPGARSAPLALAIARCKELKRIIHFDERGAAFCALGIARRSEQPVALVCTSGTAVANYFPAVIEASLTGAPLIVLSADRPARLRGSGANQAIMQPNIFGEYALISCDLHAGMTSQAVKAAIAQALQRSATQPRGVVHLNCQFDEPLIGETESTKSNTVFNAPVISPNLRDNAIIREAIAPLENIKASNLSGITILGAMSPSERQMAATIARWLGFPVLADIQSSLRDETLRDLFIPYASCGNFLQKSCASVEVIVQLGGALTSRRTLEWLSGVKHDAYIQYRNANSAWNPYGHSIHHIKVPLGYLNPGDLNHSPAAHAPQFNFSSRITAVEGIFDEAVPNNMLTEAGVTRTIWKTLPPDQTLFLASSMPIRCFDLYADVSGPHLIVSNRGASGIDGTIATAVGVSLAEERPLTVVIGDLALLHDLNSLELVAKSSHPLTIVVFNNHGGGIFAHLPFRNEPDFEELFITPHAHTFKAAAAQFDMQYEKPDDLLALDQFLSNSRRSKQSTIIEVELSWAHDQTLHQRLQELIAASEL